MLLKPTFPPKLSPWPGSRLLAGGILQCGGQRPKYVAVYCQFGFGIQKAWLSSAENHSLVNLY